MQTLKGTFVTGIKERLDANDKIYPSVFLLGTETGRGSSRDPNSQNLPARDYEGRKKAGLVPYGDQIKHMFMARDGYTFIQTDYAALELRVLAWYSGDPTLIDTFNSKIDPHIRTASNIFGVRPEDVTDDQRSIGKTNNFAVVYDQSPGALAAKLSGDLKRLVTLEEATEWQKMYKATIPVALACMEQWKSDVVDPDRQFVETYFGNRRRFPFIPSSKAAQDFKRAGGNMPIQGMAGLICHQSAVKIHKEFEKDVNRVWLTVHDDIKTETRKDMLEIVQPRIIEIMTHPDIEDRGVKFEVESKVKERWA